MTSKHAKSCSLVFVIKKMQSESPRDAVLVFSMLKSDNTIITALENRNYHVNLGTAFSSGCLP